jgi:hypothetical protein
MLPKITSRPDRVLAEAAHDARYLRTLSQARSAERKQQSGWIGTHATEVSASAPIGRMDGGQRQASSAIPWPSTVASMTMLARFSTGPCDTSAAATPAPTRRSFLDNVSPSSAARERGWHFR